MKTLTKLALVSAMAISANAMAAQMQSLDDEALSAATGQDGITLIVAGAVDAANVVIHDKDGLTPTGHGISTASAGAIVLGENAAGTGTGFSMHSASGTKPIVVTVDADGNGTAPVLNVNIALPTDFEIVTGDVYVAASTRNTAATDATLGIFSSEVKILNSMTLSLPSANINIQLGNAPQGALMKMSGSITGGLGITGFGLLDNNTYGTVAVPGAYSQTTDRGIYTDVMVKSAGSTDLSLTGTEIGVVDNGLMIRGMGNIDLSLKNLKIGSLAGLPSGTPAVAAAASIGDVVIKNMTVPTLFVKGH
ncbi:MAG: hypothetical protein E6Q25_08905 [Acinetobacter sp.]|nr:MAG: hypothetical protein E6Q25_08905 [Acinetobacter sp.]